jgi:hypothetical protein
MVVSTSAVAAPFSISNVNEGTPITLTIDSDTLAQNHSNVLITISNIVATGGLNVPSLSWPVTNQAVSLDIQSVNLWSQTGDNVGVVTVDGSTASNTISVAKSTPTYFSQNTTGTDLGTWTAPASFVASLAYLENVGALVGDTLTIQADFNIVQSGLRSNWSWGGGLSGDVTYTTVPEIASLGVLGLGSAALMLRRRKSLAAGV